MSIKFIFSKEKMGNLKSIKTKSIKLFFILGISVALCSYSISVKAQSLNEATVKEMLNKSKAGLSIPEVNQSYVVSNAYHDQLTGIDFIYLQQSFKGVKVYNAIKVIALKDGKVAYSSGKFVNKIEQKTTSIIPSVTAFNAIQNAATVLKLNIPSGLTVSQDLFVQNNKYVFTDGGIARENIPVELMWVSTDEFNTVKLAWNINIDDKNSSDWWNVRIDANDGSYLEKNNWTVHCNFSNKTDNSSSTATLIKKVVKTEQFKHLDFGGNTINKIAACPPLNITSATYYVIPFPYENININTVTPMKADTNPWLKAGLGNNAVTYGWNYDGVTNYNITKGNNVWAYDDSLNKNAPGRFDTSLTAVPSLTFGIVPDFTGAPTTRANRRAATTNLFYWNNLLHDIVYQYGFDEVSGNYQKDNMGRGGVANDYVHAEAQDGSGVDNANFSAPADGLSGRMQMYLWDITTPHRDGDFDNGVMAHEFEHGVSIRLTGGAAQSGCLDNAEQGGEGWSDYNALMVTTNWATAKLTDGTLKRPIGNYVEGQATTGKGIRTYPYSTSKTVDPHTYADISKSVGGTVGEVHYIGEIWCSAIWDMTWNIIQQEGSINPNIYDANGGGGNTIAMKLVMQGLKLQPCLPGFLDARDAILAADSILYNNKHKCAIWSAFAGRGMGYSAVQGSSGSVTDQKTATDIPSGVIFNSKYTPIVVMQNQQVTIPIKSNCTCKAPTKNYTIKVTLPSGFTYTSGTGTAAGSVVNFNPINYLVANSSDSEVLTITASGTGCKIDSVINDNRDTRFIGGFANTNITGGSVWTPTSAYSYSPVTSWQGIDDTLPTDYSLNSSAFTPSALSILSFQHLYEFENSYDGALVEYSIDNGTTWTDAKPLFIKTPYNGFIDSTSTASIANRKAFSGSSSSNFVNSIVNLSSLSGKSTMIRFRVSTDMGNSTGSANAGWVLDDISVSNGCGGIIKLVAYDSANKVRDSASIPIFITPNTMPVTYASFNVQQISKEALLRWIVAEEINTENYSVERSNDGINWVSIGNFVALGINNKEYTYYDEHPLSGVNYYRIKAIDKDGKFTYSDIRKLNFNSEGDHILIIPNPSKFQTKVFVASTAKSAKISIYDAQSRLVFSTNNSLENGGFTLSTGKYSNGVYILHIETQEGNSYSEKLLIEK